MLHNRIFIQSRSWSILFDVHADRAHQGSCHQLAQTSWVLPMWCNPMVYFLYNGKIKLLYLLILWKITNFYKRIIILESSMFGLWWLMHYYLVVSLRLKSIGGYFEGSAMTWNCHMEEVFHNKISFACLHVYK